MMGTKFVVTLGLLCLAASYTSAQTTDFATQLPAAAATDFETGSYLVNGTGVVYDPSSITFYLNGTAVGTVPNPKAGAPGPSVLDHTILDHPDLPVKQDKTTTVAQGPGTSATEQTDIFNTVLGQLKDGPNPLDSIIIGRKLLSEEVQA